jgi:hypothetical protein
VNLYVPVVTPDGVLWVQASELDWYERSTAATHINYVTQGLATGDYGAVQAFRDVRVGGLPLATDRQDIEELADQGDLDFDYFYWDPRHDRH